MVNLRCLLFGHQYDWKKVKGHHHYRMACTRCGRILDLRGVLRWN